jgi:hypothetical protein
VNLCYVRLPLLYSDIIYYLNCCNTVMPLKCDPVRKIVDDSGFPRTPDRLLKFCDTHVWWLEVFKTITSTCGPYYLGGSATPRPRPQRPDVTPRPCAHPAPASIHRPHVGPVTCPACGCALRLRRRLMAIGARTVTHDGAPSTSKQLSASHRRH